MGIISSIRALSVTDEKAWDKSLWNLHGSQSVSGENVSEHTVLTLSSVWNAVVLIAGTIGALPCHLMQSKGEKKRIADDRRMYRVLHDEYNPYMTAMAGRECLMAHALLWGNGYAEIVRNGYGELMELWPITPDRIKAEMRNGALVYRIRVANEDIYLPREKVLHVPGMGFDGFNGFLPMMMARKSIGLAMAMETFGALYFGQGTHPGVVVGHPGKLSDPARDNLKNSLAVAHSGLGKSHKLLLLEEGMTIQKLLIENDKSQFLESRVFQIDEVARWFNIPIHKLKEMTKSSFSNIESEQRSFYGDTILPWLVRLEQNYNMQLLTTSDKEFSGRGRLYFKHNAKGILRADTEAQGTFYGGMLDRGVFSINEVRELEDKDPVEGGDIHLVPLNMTSLENAGKPPEPTPAPKALPMPNEDDTPPGRMKK